MKFDYVVSQHHCLIVDEQGEEVASIKGTTLTRQEQAEFFAEALTEYHVKKHEVVQSLHDQYAGVVIIDGVISHHLVLLPYRGTNMTWDAVSKNLLPTMQELYLIAANCNSIQLGFVWSSYSPQNLDFAHAVDFLTNEKKCLRKDQLLNVLHVRRVPILGV